MLSGCGAGIAKINRVNRRYGQLGREMLLMCKRKMLFVKKYNAFNRNGFRPTILPIIIEN